MEALFLKLMNLSINAGWLVLVVMLVRVVFRRCPKWVFCLLWDIVALRLICPFTLESPFSLLPSAEPLPKEIIYTANPQIQSGITVIDNTINPILSDALAVPENTFPSANPSQIWSFILGCIWAIGCGLMLVYGFVSTLMLRRRLATATLLEKGIKQSEWIDTPIVFGFFRPTIYLPYHLSERDTTYVIAHEKAHIQRKDHLWKALGFLLLSVYWFHPLMWCAYLLFGKDVESACDEKVIRDMEKAEKQAYSMALLNCSTNRRQKLVYPLAFGEISVKERVSNVMNYKKPAFWVVVVAIVGCVAVAVGFLTSPKSNGTTPPYTNSEIDFDSEAQVPAKFRAEEALFYFFDGFSKGDYASMRDYCTEDFQQMYFHEEDVFGMKTAEIQEMVGEGLLDGSFSFMVDVNMKPSEMSTFYPETSTTVFVHLAKVNDKWLIDGFSTGGNFSTFYQLPDGTWTEFDKEDDNEAVLTDKNNFNAMAKDELIPYFQTAEKAVETYYKTRMELTSSQSRKLIEQTKQANPNASDYEVIKTIALSGMGEFSLGLAVKDYLGGKFAYEALPALEDSYETIYQDGTYSVEDWKVLDDMLICSVAATESFQYSDSTGHSLLGELIQVVIRNPQNPQIIDWYEDDKGNFDSMVRGYHVDLSKSENLITNMSSDTLNQKIMSCFANSASVLLTEGKAAYQASLKARAYIEFHKDEFPDADYDEIEPIVTVELTDVEEFDTRAYKVNVEYPVPESTNSPAFEMLIDANSGDTLRTTPLNR